MDNNELDSPVRHRRSPKAIASALLRKQNYTGIVQAFRLSTRPVDFLSRYIRNSGSYPADVTLRTPTGLVAAHVYAPDDIQTINEIFFRGDYQAGGNNKVVVDFGSNIGISALYFLSRQAGTYVYCYEPLPQNIERLRRNLAPYGGQYELAEIAVGESDGTVRFGWEPTGRYGGVGRDTGRWIDVPCRDSNSILREIVARHGVIDLLKIDIETLEKAVTERIPVDLARQIRSIVVEYPFTANPLAQTHNWTRKNNVTTFTLKQ